MRLSESLANSLERQIHIQKSIQNILESLGISPGSLGTLTESLGTLPESLGTPSKSLAIPSESLGTLPELAREAPPGPGAPLFGFFPTSDQTKGQTGVLSG